MEYSAFSPKSKSESGLSVDISRLLSRQIRNEPDSADTVGQIGNLPDTVWQI
jgi:hypothetical protein